MSDKRDDIRKKLAEKGLSGEALTKKENEIFDTTVTRSTDRLVLEQLLDKDKTNFHAFDSIVDNKQLVALNNYREMMGVGQAQENDWVNLSDKTINAITEEILMNVTLIALSGGIAAGARLAGGSMMRYGASKIGQEALLQGASRLGSGTKIAKGMQWAGMNPSLGGLSGLALEGVAFDSAQQWLANGDFSQMSKGSVGMSIATLGALKFAHGFGTKLPGGQINNRVLGSVRDTATAMPAMFLANQAFSKAGLVEGADFTASEAGKEAATLFILSMLTRGKGELKQIEYKPKPNQKLIEYKPKEVEPISKPKEIIKRKEQVSKLKERINNLIDSIKKLIAKKDKASSKDKPKIETEIKEKKAEVNKLKNLIDGLMNGKNVATKAISKLIPKKVKKRFERRNMSEREKELYEIRELRKTHVEEKMKIREKRKEVNLVLKNEKLTKPEKERLESERHNLREEMIGTRERQANEMKKLTSSEYLKLSNIKEQIETNHKESKRLKKDNKKHKKGSKKRLKNDAEIKELNNENNRLKKDQSNLEKKLKDPKENLETKKELAKELANKKKSLEIKEKLTKIDETGLIISFNGNTYRSVKESNKILFEKTENGLRIEKESRKTLNEITEMISGKNVEFKDGIALKASKVLASNEKSPIKIEGPAGKAIVRSNLVSFNQANSSNMIRIITNEKGSHFFVKESYKLKDGEINFKWI